MSCESGNFCINSIKHVKIEPEISKTENFNFGDALSEIYPLLELIFNYLTLEDLKLCCKVCTIWKEKGLYEISRRISPSWFSCSEIINRISEINFSIKNDKRISILSSPNLNYDNAALGIILYNKINSCRIRLNDYVCLHNNISQLCRKPLLEYLEEELVPSDIDYCVISVDEGFSVFESKDNNNTLQERYSCPIFNGLLIPKIPSIRTVLFHCNPFKKNDVEETVKIYMNSKSNERVKCLLIFSKTVLSKKALNDLFQVIVQQDEAETVALGGGVIERTKTVQKLIPEKKFYSAKDTVCIVFLKDINYNNLDNFKAYSYVIKEKSSEEFKAKLLTFKANIEIKHHSLGFGFSCIENLMEEKIFYAVFPEIPFLGLAAHGEIGWNCYSASDSQNVPKSAKRIKTECKNKLTTRFRSTCFVLLTWD